MSPERARTHTRRASRDLFVELISIASLRVPVCGCVYTRMSVCTAGIGLCSVAQFWLNKGEYCRTDKETGVQRDRYRYKWEKGEGGRERCWQLKHPSPLWLPCVWSFIFVCVCFAPKSVVFSSVVSLPVVPLSGESMFTQHALWAVTVGVVHPPSPRQPTDAPSFASVSPSKRSLFSTLHICQVTAEWKLNRNVDSLKWSWIICRRQTVSFPREKGRSWKI